MGKFYKDINLDEVVTIECPVFLIVAAVASYQDAPWASGAMSQLMARAERAILSPVYVKEQEAAHQEMNDRIAQHGPFGLLFATPQDESDPRLEDEG